MAEATWVKGPNTLDLVVAATNTWVCTDYFPKGIILHSIQMLGAANDVLVMRDGGTSTTVNPKICHMKDDGKGRQVVFRSAKIGGDKTYRNPVLCISECTIGSTNFAVILEYEL